MRPSGEFEEMAEVAIPFGSMAPGAARVVVADCLAGVVAPRMVDDSQLLISELVTNSVCHGGLSDGDSVLVRIYLGAREIRLEVENAGTAGVVAVHDGEPGRGGGFGLQLVERLVARWGVVRGRDTTVWLEMARA